MDEAGEKLKRAFTGAFALLFAVIVLCAVFCNQNVFGTQSPRSLLAGGLALAVGVLCAAWLLRLLPAPGKRLRRTLLAAFFTLCFLAQAHVGRALVVGATGDWDFGIVLRAALDFAADGAQGGIYFNNFPNNQPLMLLLAGLFRLLRACGVTEEYELLVWGMRFGAVLLQLALFFLYLCAARLLGRRAGALALLLAAAALGAVLAGGGADSAAALWQSVSRRPNVSRGLLRWELGDILGLDGLSAPTVLALGQSPVLLAGRTLAVRDAAPQPEAPDQPAAQEAPAPAPSEEQDPQPGADNGVPAQTVDPRSTDGYSIINGVYIKNKSSRTLDPAVLGDRQFVACPRQGPQVLIVHSHASEAYTMPPGREYVPSGTFRTADCSCNMVRVGDELAAALSAYGISVVHDRTLHDGQSYNDAYENSLASIRSYLAKYPSIVYVLDLHRDAVQDANGTQYKLVTAEDPSAAQVSLIMGVAHDGWQDNLRLAIAVQEKLETQSPTLMRPITLLNYRYNQFAAPGSLLVEVGAAGNSLEEALQAARLFGRDFAETILGQ